ncbi:hypothetical protein [Streptomyces sp. NPDC001851]
MTNAFELCFHALETALGLQLPQRAIQEGSVQAAQWAGAGKRRTTV